MVSASSSRILIGIVFALGFLDAGAEIGQRDRVDDASGSRTVTVGGNYKSMTQESLADGMKINVDGHVITHRPAIRWTVDGKTQVLEPDQDMEIRVDEKGAVAVKVVSSSRRSRQRLRNRRRVAPAQRAGDLGEQRRPGVLGLAREVLLERLLERPQQRLGHHAVVARS